MNHPSVAAEAASISDQLRQLTKVLYTHDFEFNPELDMSVFSR